MGLMILRFIAGVALAKYFGQESVKSARPNLVNIRSNQLINVAINPSSKAQPYQP